nr:pilin N-terminal domain-containing protein [Weissella diestrammenae]
MTDLGNWRPLDNVNFVYYDMMSYLDWKDGEIQPVWRTGTTVFPDNATKANALDQITAHFSIVQSSNSASRWQFEFHTIDHQQHLTNDQLLHDLTVVAGKTDSSQLTHTEMTGKSTTSGKGNVDLSLSKGLWLIIEDGRPHGVSQIATPMLLSLPTENQNGVRYGPNDTVHFYPKNYTMSTSLNKMVDPDGQGYVENDDKIGVYRGHSFKWAIDITLPATAEDFQTFMLKDVLPHQVDLQQIKIFQLAGANHGDVLWSSDFRPADTYMTNGISGHGQTYDLSQNGLAVTGQDGYYQLTHSDGSMAREPIVNSIDCWSGNEINKTNQRCGWFEINLQPHLKNLVEKGITSLRVEVTTIVNAAATTGLITNEARLTDDLRTRQDKASTWVGGYDFVKTNGPARYHEDADGHLTTQVFNPVADATFQLLWHHAPAGITLKEGGVSKADDTLYYAGRASDGGE